MRARVKDEGTGLGGLVRRLFAERQLLLRSGDRVLFVPFSRRLQIGLCVALLAAAGWTGFATVAFLRHEARVPALHQRIAADGLAYRGLLAQVAGFQRKFDSIADALDRDHDLMLGLVAQNASLRQGVVALGGRLGSSEKELDQAAAARRAVDADVATMESNLRELTERNGMLRRRLARVQDALRTAMAERDRHQARGTQLARDVAALKEETEGLENARRDAGRRLARVQDALGTAMAERDRHQARGTQLARDVAALKGEIEGLENARRDAGRRLADRTLAYMETVESVDRDLRQAVQARDDAVLEAARKAERAEALEGQVSRLQDLVAETEDALEVRTLAHGDDMELARADLRSVEGERNEALAIASRLEGRVRELEVRLSDLKRSRRLAEGALSDRTVAHAVNVHALRAELDKAVAERDRVLRISTRLTDRVKALEGRVDDFHGEKLAAELRLSERTDAYEAVLETARSDLRSALEARSRATVASGHRQRRIEELEQRLVVLTTSKAFANRRFQDQSLAYQEDIETLRGRLEEVVEERDAARRSRDSLGEMVGVLETRLTHLQQSQEEAVQRLTARAVASIGELERLVALTGLELDGLLVSEDDRYRSQGGPFVGIEPDGLPGDRLLAGLTVLDRHLAHWDALRSALRRLPVTPPLEAFYVTSSFGKRRDPINGRWAMHYGLDLGGVFRSSVHATAPGEVTFAGWKGRYGRMVEVDHGAGLKTRYGHLHRISVQKGDRVRYRHKLGLLGSTGRSTGAHLHYEVEFQGKSMDPMKFIRAGRHVLQDNQAGR